MNQKERREAKKEVLRRLLHDMIWYQVTNLDQVKRLIKLIIKSL